MKWLRTGEVAKLFGWSRKKAQRMCEKGTHFPNARVDDGGQWRVPQPDVEAYRQKRREWTERARRIARGRKNRDITDNKTN